MVNQDGESTTSPKLATGTKPSISNLRVLFFPYVVQKLTLHVNINSLNMHHQPQKVSRDIFVGIPQNQKGYLVYVPSTRKKKFLTRLCVWQKQSRELAHISHPYSEALMTQPDVSYIPYTTLSCKKTGNIIAFAQFEEGGSLENERDLE